jgi:hypothetical protein
MAHPVDSAQSRRPEEDVNQQGVQRVHNRWAVHLGLMVTFGAALASLVLLRGATTIHILLGLAFVALVAVHLSQRRQAVNRLTRQLAQVRSWFRPRGRLAWSDVILGLLTVNVLISGTVDWVDGHDTALPLQALRIGYLGWHGISSLVLLCYLLVHVLRRRRRLRTSHIR